MDGLARHSLTGEATAITDQPVSFPSVRPRRPCFDNAWAICREADREGEKNYGLDAQGLVTILAGYERVGYGFSPYPTQQSYGISICTASKLMSLIEEAGHHPIFYREGGWVKHRDCVAVAKMV
jgi:hypothetical protein